MATKGTAAKSASGAAMSKYDVEVEGRLQALEAKATRFSPPRRKKAFLDHIWAVLWGSSDPVRSQCDCPKILHIFSGARVFALPTPFTNLQDLSKKN